MSGYPEISYFVTGKLLPVIRDNSYLYIRFVNVHLYVDKSNKNVNYEDLFNLTSENGGDPSESSLFNIKILKHLID